MIRTIAAAGLLACTAASAFANILGPVEVALRKADGTRIGGATMTEARGGLHVEIRVSGLAPGRYGAHIHSIGRCEGPGFESAGPHWNPAGREHGSLNPRGHHLGDLPNLDVGTDGRGTISFDIPGTTMEGARDARGDGGSLVIHAAPDDYRSDPSGNSGARIACGVLIRRG